MPTPAQCLNMLETCSTDLQHAAVQNAAEQLQVNNAIKALGGVAPLAATKEKR